MLTEISTRSVNAYQPIVGSDGEYVKEYMSFLRSDSDVPNEAYKNANIRAISNAIKVCK